MATHLLINTDRSVRVLELITDEQEEIAVARRPTHPWPWENMTTSKSQRYMHAHTRNSLEHNYSNESNDGSTCMYMYKCRQHKKAIT